MPLYRVPVEKWILACIVLLAVSLRVWGVNFGLPYIYHPDEPRYVESAQLLFKTHNLDPRSLPNLSSSSFVYVLNAIAYIPYYLVGKATGVFHLPTDITAPKMLALGTGMASMPSTFLLGRAMTVLFSLASVILVYLIGNNLFHRKPIGLIAALLLAISSTNVTHSRFITSDTFVTFFVLLAFYGAVGIYQQNKLLQYVVTGIALGCVVSCKVSGILIALPLPMAYFYRKERRGWLDPKVYWLAIAGGVAFLATTPYILGNMRDVIGDILAEGHHYSTGHAGMEGNSLLWYLTYMWQTAAIVYILSAMEILRGIYTRSKEMILLSIFPIFYFAFISSFVVRNDRTFLPMTPFLFVLAASLLVHLTDAVNLLRTKSLRTFSILTLTGLSIASLISPISWTISDAIRLTTVDSRETARIWIDNNLPHGAKMAIESYSPFIDRSRFSVKSFGQMIEHEPDWYVEQGFDYLVFSQGMYGRYYLDSEKYGKQIARYENFFIKFETVKIFTDGGYEVRVYKTK